MCQIIYVDVLICVNLFINYFILLLTARFLNIKPDRKRLILASFVGSLYALFIFFDNMPALVSVAIKLLMSATIILLGFGLLSVRSFFKAIFTFYIINFLFGGIIFFIWYFISPKEVLVKNGMVYFNISPVFIVVSTLIIYLNIKVYNKLIGQKDLFSSLCRVEIEHGGKSVILSAKIDTGCELKEPFSGKPAVVADYKSVQKILPSVFEKYAGGGDFNYSAYPAPKIRMIPFKTIAGEGILPAFMPDKLKITYKKTIYQKEAFVAVSNKKIFEESYSAIVNPELID